MPRTPVSRVQRQLQQPFPGVPTLQRHQIRRRVRIQTHIAFVIHTPRDVGQVQPRFAVLTRIPHQQRGVRPGSENLHGVPDSVVRRRACVCRPPFWPAIRACSGVH